jgi:hypothetical protein
MTTTTHPHVARIRARRASVWSSLADRWGAAIARFADRLTDADSRRQRDAHVRFLSRASDVF